MIKVILIINIIIAVQAFFLVFHFFFKKKGDKSLNRLLGSLCFCFAILAIRAYTYINPFLEIETIFTRISHHVIWFIGPLFYLYVISYEHKPSKKRVLLNIVPYVLIALGGIFFNWGSHIVYLQKLSVIQVSIYLILSIRYCFKNYKRAKQFYSWILPALFTMTFMIVFYLVIVVSIDFNINILPSELRRSLSSFLAIPIFYITYKEMNSSNEFGIQPKKYKTSPLSTEKRAIYLKKIEKEMQEEKVFLNQNLTLQTFSKSIGIQSKYISQVINQNLDLSFSEYLLQYRIDEVKKNLLDPKKANLTIYGIAQDSGFSSNSRFNYLFKKDTGLTPKQFRNQKK